jgi:hypothetical protein
MSVKSKNQKKKRLYPKMLAFYNNYSKWLSREPSTANFIAHAKWEDEEPVKPKWLIEYEEGNIAGQS